MSNPPIVVLSDDDSLGEDNEIAFLKITRRATTSRPAAVVIQSDSEDGASIDELFRETASAVDHDQEAVTKPKSSPRKRRRAEPDETGKERVRRVHPNKAEKALAHAAKKREAEKSLQKKVAEVNKLRTSKNDTVREIELYLAADMSTPLSPIAAALPEITARFLDNQSAVHFLPPEDSPIAGAIRVKRHVKARWDHTARRFMPLEDPYSEWDPTVILVTEASAVVGMITQGEDSLLRWAQDARLLLECNEQLIIVVKDLGKYLAFTKTLENREFTALARAGLAEGAKRGMSTGGRVSRDHIEAELVNLQVQEKVFVVHANRTEDMEDWVWNLCADIALRPYKLLAKSHLTFAAGETKRKAGSSSDALECMLQEVQGITASAAAGIASEHHTFALLMRAFEKAERRGSEHAEAMLADCEVRNSKNGTASGRKLNKALSRRVYQLLRGNDSLALA